MLEYHGLTLDPFQERAIREIEQGHSVLVAAPTGAGKTLIAEYALEKCLREGRRIVYTAPKIGRASCRERVYGLV